MHKITIRLSDAEFAELERRAAQERRSVSNFVEKLVTAMPMVVSTLNPRTFADQIAWNGADDARLHASSNTSATVSTVPSSFTAHTNGSH